MRILFRYYTDSTKTQKGSKVISGDNLYDIEKDFKTQYPEAEVYARSQIENGRDSLVTGSNMLTRM